MDFVNGKRRGRGRVICWCDFSFVILFFGFLGFYCVCFVGRSVSGTLDVVFYLKCFGSGVCLFLFRFFYVDVLFYFFIFVFNRKNFK